MLNVQVNYVPVRTVIEMPTDRAEFYRRELSPREFAERCERFEELHPEASQTSGKRSTHRNKTRGGKDDSKHLIGMARDYAWDIPPTVQQQTQYMNEAKLLGLWADYHAGHLHVQGLPPGEPSDHWKERYLWMRS
jgi:hypothetical protein